MDRARVAARWDLVLPHRPALVRVARSRGLSPDEAEECAHEAMLRCVEFRALDEARVLPFLVSTTIRLCADRGREQVRDRRLAAKLTAWHCADSSPEDQVCDREEAAWLAGMLGTLPEAQGKVLAARVEGLGNAEVAERLQVSYKVVESHLYRLRLRARGLLAGALGVVLALTRRVNGTARTATMTAVAAVATISVLAIHSTPAPPSPPERPFVWSDDDPLAVVPVALAPSPDAPGRGPRPEPTGPPRPTGSPTGRPGGGASPTCVDQKRCVYAPPTDPCVICQTWFLNCVTNGIESTERGPTCRETPASSSPILP